MDSPVPALGIKFIRRIFAHYTASYYETDVLTNWKFNVVEEPRSRLLEILPTRPGSRPTAFNLIGLNCQ